MKTEAPTKKSCPECQKEVGPAKVYCSRTCARQGWKAKHAPIPPGALRAKAKLDRDVDFLSRRQAP